MPVETLSTAKEQGAAAAPALQDAVLKTGSHRRWWQSVLQSIAALALVVVALEMMFAFAGLGEEEYLKPHPDLGFAGIPNKPITWRHEGFSRFRFNSLGYNDTEHPIAKPAATTRIAIVGDSYVASMQVDRSKNFSNLLQNRLNSEKHPTKYEVLNFGTNSSNLGQLYIRLQKHAQQYSPDIVVMPIRIDAGFQLMPNPKGGFLYIRPTFYIDKAGNLAVDRNIEKEWAHSSEARRMRMTGWLREHSRIYGVVGKLAEQLAGWWMQVKAGTYHWGAQVTDKQTAFGGGDGAANESGVVKGKPATYRVPRPESDVVATKYAWPVADLVLKATKEYCDAHGSKLVIIRLPAAQHWYNDTETQLLKETCARYDIPFADASPTFEKNLSDDKDSLYYLNHFTPRGQRFFTDVVYKCLSDNKLLN